MYNFSACFSEGWEQSSWVAVHRVEELAQFLCHLTLLMAEMRTAALLLGHGNQSSLFTEHTDGYLLNPFSDLLRFTSEAPCPSTHHRSAPSPSVATCLLS